MITTAYINLWNKRVGALLWDKDKRQGFFEFERNFYTHNWNVSPIKMPIGNYQNKIFSFPELRNNTTFKGLPGLLADALPDKYGSTLINTWLTINGRPSNSLSPIEQLCFIGKRAMGALEFEPVEPSAHNNSTKLELNTLIDLVQEILQGKKKFTTQLKKNDEKAIIDILKIGTSAGGARAKALIAYNPLTKEVRSGQTDAPKGYSQWIVKFDGVHELQLTNTMGYGRVEMAYHLMAQDAGINMSECRLLEENNRAHFMTKRFDRINEKEKIHIQSFCAMNHYDFNEVGNYSYEQLFETMRILLLPYADAEQLYRRMVFNVLAKNCDDHCKNFGFMMQKSGEWRLTPAYDICHAYKPDSIWVSQHSLSINGKRTNITKNDLLSVAKKMNIKKATQIIEQIQTVVNNWKQYANKAFVDKKLLTAIEKTFEKI
jgi:serine/threonine-protein kinase HipA